MFFFAVLMHLIIEAAQRVGHDFDSEAQGLSVGALYTVSIGVNSFTHHKEQVCQVHFQRLAAMYGTA